MNAVSRSIPDPVLAVLSAGRCEASRFFLPAATLDRKMYEAVNKVLDSLGGKWNRSAKAHVFSTECADLIDAAIETGEYTKPSDMGWFPTPDELAKKIVGMADVRPEHRVLEPSAGEGAIVRHLIERAAHVTAFEIDEVRATKLVARMDQDTEGHSWTLWHGNFLERPPLPGFDRVVMNPPFAKRADIHHVTHARKFLRPGGRLVSIVAASVVFRDDALTRSFRDQCDSVEMLPDESFKASGTSVRTAVITMGSQP